MLDISYEEDDELDLGMIILDIIEKGRIYGYIVDTKDEPIGGAKIRLKGIKKALKTVSFDTNGFFEFVNLETGKYKIFTKKKGYKRNKKNILFKEGEEKKVEIYMKEK